MYPFFFVSLSFPACGYVPPMGPPPPPFEGGAAVSPTLVVHQYVAAPNFGHRPVDMICPHCQTHVRTSTESEPGPMAWVLAAILCVVG